MSDENQTLVAEHRVNLNPGKSEYRGFVDLARYLWERRVPDRLTETEAQLVDRLGAWIGKVVLGDALCRLLVDNAPMVIDVALSVDAEFLLYRPLELAHLNGVPLARQHVSFVYFVEGEVEPVIKQPVEGALRMLAVFSVPTDGTALALRRERYELTHLIHKIVADYGRAIELRVLQYGVTRERVQQELQGHDTGWDVVHFSGHGLAHGLVLERPDGSADVLHTQDLVAALYPVRRRLKLVTLSSCWSAAPTMVDTRRWLSLEVSPELETVASVEEQKTSASAGKLPGLARETVKRLSCAVVAMRFSVADEFTIALSKQLYEELFIGARTLPRALQLAISTLSEDRHKAKVSPISVATPTLVGPLAGELQLVAPIKKLDGRPAIAKRADIPEESMRFVGRTGTMARAGMALAPLNPQGHNTILFHGMAGAGKSSCALELAHQHEHSFATVLWWQAPEDDKQISPRLSLRDLAVRLETQLGSVAIVHAVGDPERLTGSLATLTRQLEAQPVLIVLDNLESLVSEDGRWRDPHWGLLVQALTNHAGSSRLILTSRVAPKGLDAERLLIEPIHTLPLNEALLLAREFPHLGRLIRQASTVRTLPGTDPEAAASALVRRVLAVVQGHPKLLELADAMAADPQDLMQRLAEAEHQPPTETGQLDRFFAHGSSELAPKHFLQLLDGWTHAAVNTLADGSRALFWFLCGLEETDRVQWLVESMWPELWRRLAQGPPPALEPAHTQLTTHALVQAEWQARDEAVHYRIHPAVAEAGRRQAGPEFRGRVDALLAAHWRTIAAEFRRQHKVGGHWLVRAGISGAPYAMRRQDWAAATSLLEHAVRNDESPSTLQAALALLSRIIQGAQGTNSELPAKAAYAVTLALVNPEQAEQQLRTLLLEAAAAKQPYVVRGIGSNLVAILIQSGRLKEALERVEEMRVFREQAGAGRLAKLADESNRLQILLEMGHHEQVLAKVETLREELAALPEIELEDHVEPWRIREVMLTVGGGAAQELEQWETALLLHEEAIRSAAARGCTPLHLARLRRNLYRPLLSLNRLEEAHQVLLACRAVFQDRKDLASMGGVLSALAEVSTRRGHLEDAIGFERAALRYRYVMMEPIAVANSHFRLALQLGRGGHGRRSALCHGLAAAVIYYQTGHGHVRENLRMLAYPLRRIRDPGIVPESFEALCLQVEQVEGVRFAELLERLPGSAPTGAAAFAEVLRRAWELARTGD